MLHGANGTTRYPLITRLPKHRPATDAATHSVQPAHAGCRRIFFDLPVHTPPSNQLKKLNSRSSLSWDRLLPRHAAFQTTRASRQKPPYSKFANHTSFAPETTSTKHNERKMFLRRWMDAR